MIEEESKSVPKYEIYVSWIPFDIGQMKLYETFEPFGRILGIKIKRGFGFIEFEMEQSV